MLRTPPQRLPGDARRYGRLRRSLLVAGLARSTIGVAAFAFGLAPAIGGALCGRPRAVALAGTFLPALAAGTILGLPVDFIENYELERRFGLSEQTAGHWLRDQLKGAAVSDAIAAALALGAGEIVYRAPRSWPWIAAVLTVPFMVFAGIVAPVYLMPLFNTFEPLAGPLEVRLRRLAARYGAGDAAILRVDMSKQTRKANAYVTGLLGTHRIVIGDTLLATFTDDEISFIVAHELGHYVRRDMWRGVATGAAAAFALLPAAAEAARRAAPPRVAQHDAAGLALVLFFVSAGSVVTYPAFAALSRRREWAADRFALEATGDAAAGAAAFRRLRDQNLAEDEQPRWMETLFATHPSLKRRVAALDSAGSPKIVAAAHD